MRKLTLLLIIICSFSLQSCLDILEEINLNKKGDGDYAITFDMSSLFANPMMKEMLLQGLSEQEGMPDITVDGNLEVDTLVAFKDAPLTGGNTADMPAILKKATMAMKVSESKGEFKMKMALDFDDPSEIGEFYKALNSIGEGQQQGLGGMMPGQALFDTKKRTLIRKGAGAESMSSALDEEQLSMMRMVMASATYKVIYNLPKKVKRHSLLNSTVDGKKITVEASYLDILEGKTKLDGEVKW